MANQLNAPAISGTQAVSAPPAARRVLNKATPPPAQTGNNSNAMNNFQEFGLPGTD